MNKPLFSLVLLAVIASIASGVRPGPDFPPELKNTNLPDTVSAKKMLENAVQLLDSAKYDSAIILFRRAEVLFAAAGRHEKSAHAFNGIGAAYNSLVIPDSSKKYSELALTILHKHNKGTSDEAARAHNNLGESYKIRGLYEKALKEYHKSLKTRLKFPERHGLLIAMTYGNIGSVYVYLNDHEQAGNYFLKALDIYNTTPEAKNSSKALVVGNIGAIYFNKGNYAKARGYFSEAFRLFEEELPPDHPYFGILYNNIGAAFGFEGDYDKGLEYIKKATAVSITTLGDRSLQAALNYNNIGTCFVNKGENHEALKWFRKSLNIRLRHFGEDHPDVAVSFNQVATCFDNTGMPDSAFYYFNKSLNLKIKLLGKDHPDVALVYNNLGVLYEHLNNYKRARYYHDMALKIRKKVLDKHHPETATSLINIGVLQTKERKWEEVIKTNQEALLTLNYTSESSSRNYKNVTSKPIALKALFNKALALENLESSKKQSIENEKSSYQTYQSAVALIKSMRDEYTASGAKSVIKSSVATYEGSIRTANKLYASTGNAAYLEAAFSATEQTKSFLLYRTLKDNKAKRYAGIPDSVLDAERDMKIDVSFYEKQLYKAEQKEDSAKIIMYRNYLFEKKDQYENLVKTLENNFSDYYKLKYDTRTASLKEVQAFLPKNTKLIEYFLGDSAIYIFDITKNQFRIHEISKPKGFEDTVTAFREELSAVSFSKFVKQDKKGKNVYFKKWIRQNQFLAEHLIKPVLDNKETDLIIIPDGVLGYLPFEVLLTEKKWSSVTDFSDLPYLIRSKQLSYAYSASLLVDDASDMREDSFGSLKPLAAFAPNYTGKVVQTKDTIRHDLTAMILRNGLTPLKNNVAEAKNAVSILGGDVFTNFLASKQNFQKTAASYRILHLAGHSVIDDNQPLYSSIVFTKTSADSSNRLETAELYNMKLNARLAVLSACETGYGKLDRGEGIMSLSRAFAYAGVPTLVMSLWKTDDQSSAKIMDIFYRKIGEGNSVTEALHTAKIDYLRQTAHPYYSHPFFWAAFVASGDSVSVDHRFDRRGVLGIIGTFLFFIIITLAAHRFPRKTS